MLVLMLLVFMELIIIFLEQIMLQLKKRIIEVKKIYVSFYSKKNYLKKYSYKFLTYLFF